MRIDSSRPRSHLTWRRSWLPLVLLAGCGSKGPVDGAAALRHVEALVALGPRPFGSEALGKAADYICGELTKLGLEPRRQEVMHEQEHKLIRNLYAQVDGEDPQNGPILLIGSHYDTKLTAGMPDPGQNFRFVGAIDGTGGAAVLIELARALKARPQKPKLNVWLYWIDAEESIDFEWNSARALLGSKAFAKWLVEQKLKDRVRAFVLLDLIGDKNIKIDRDGNSNEELQRIFEQAGQALGETARIYQYPRRMEIEELERRGQHWGTTDDHETFRDYGIPSVLLIDFYHRVPPERMHLRPGQQAPDPEGYAQWWHTERDTPEQMSAWSLAFAGNLVLQALPALEDFILKRKR